MHPATRRLFLALALALCAAGAARAQSEQPKPQEENYVTQKAFSSRVFDIRNRDPISLSHVLMPLTSGFRGAAVIPNPEFHTISVRDFPENIAVIEEAIRRLDTPKAVRPPVEFRVHMLVASNDDAAAGPYPAELADVVKQLQATLGYKNFSLMGSQIVRSKDGRGDNFNRGVANIKASGDPVANKNPVFYSYNIRSVTLDHPTPGPARVQIEEFSLDMKVPIARGTNDVAYEGVGFKNPITLREGERVVVGTTSIADKSVVVVLTATAMK